MSQSEFLSVLPLVLYGLALHDIFEHWRSIFRSKPHIPFIILIVILFEACINSVYRFWNVIQELPDLSYWGYFRICIPAVLFLLSVKMLTPEEGKSPEEYLKKEGRKVFILLGVYTISTYFIHTGIFSPSLWASILVPATLFTIAYTRRLELVYFIALIQLCFILDEIFQWGIFLSQ